MDDWTRVPEPAPGGFVAVGPGRVVGAPPHWSVAPPPPPPPEARKKNGWATFWHIVLGLDIAFMVLVVALNLFVFLVAPALPEEAAGGGSKAQLWAESLLSFAMFGLIPLAWVAGTRVQVFEGTKRYLRLDRFWVSVAHGVGYAALLLGLVLLLSLVLDMLGVDAGGGSAEERFSRLDWPLVFGISFIAGFGEEVFFRGVLQKWVGVWGQAIIFGLFHLPGGILAFVITGGIGLLFGFLVKRGRSLWLVITAHFVYDLFLLAGTLVAERAGEPGFAAVFGV